MKFKIGFKGYEEEKKEDLQVAKFTESSPVKSVVQVQFPSKGRSLAYYNDKFDLHVGDIVFVDGKLEGIQGIVTEVSRSFKIKLSDYKRVIAVADTNVKGEFYLGGSHLIAFDEDVIPYDKIRGWFLPPETDTEVAVGYDDESFPLDDLGGLNIRSEIADRGFDYYNRNKVLYICALNLPAERFAISTADASAPIIANTSSRFCYSFARRSKRLRITMMANTLNRITSPQSTKAFCCPTP